MTPPLRCPWSSLRSWARLATRSAAAFCMPSAFPHAPFCPSTCALLYALVAKAFILGWHCPKAGLLLPSACLLPFCMCPAALLHAPFYPSACALLHGFVPRATNLGLALPQNSHIITMLASLVSSASFLPAQSVHLCIPTHTFAVHILSHAFVIACISAALYSQHLMQMELILAKGKTAFGVVLQASSSTPPVPWTRAAVILH